MVRVYAEEKEKGEVMLFESKQGALCIAKDAETLTQFKSLQMLLALDDPSIDVDGQIDPKTLAAANQQGGFIFPTCDALANNIDIVLVKLGVFIAVDPVTGKKTPLVVDPVTGKKTPLVSTSKAGFAVVGLLLLGGLGAWLYYEDKKRPKKDRWF